MYFNTKLHSNLLGLQKVSLWHCIEIFRHLFGDPHDKLLLVYFHEDNIGTAWIKIKSKLSRSICYCFFNNKVFACVFFLLQAIIVRFPSYWLESNSITLQYNKGKVSLIRKSEIQKNFKYSKIAHKSNVYRINLIIKYELGWPTLTK